MKLSGALMVFTIFRSFVYRKRPKRSPRKLEKPLFSEMLPTEHALCPEIFTANHVPLARFEIFSGQNFSARNLKIPKIFGLKFEKSKKSWRESWKKGCEFSN